MGHSSVTVTKLYMHLHPNYKRADILKMARNWADVRANLLEDE